MFELFFLHMPRGTGTRVVDSSGLPKAISGYIPSSTSRDQISISGSIVPTAMWFPNSFFGEVEEVAEELANGKSSHSRRRGKFGSIRSWWA